jgi:sulfite reductase alpha subunit-like flavoprotein
VSRPCDQSFKSACIQSPGVCDPFPDHEGNFIVLPSVNTLYFGCRSANKDQHYSAEWKNLSLEQKLAYRVACSRDGPEGAKRTYVQDLIREDAETIWQLIGLNGAWVYISG